MCVSRRTLDAWPCRLQNATLDGHALQLKLSAKQLKSDAAVPSKRKTTASSGGTKATKLLVKNLAFEAVKKDLQELFGAFGQVCDSLVLPDPLVGPLPSLSLCTLW